MLTRKTQYAWMALGGLICLLGLVLACKLRDGNKAIAQPEKLDLPPIISTTDDKQLASPPPAMLTKPATTSEMSLMSFQATEPALPAPKPRKTEEPARKEPSAPPKAMLSMPFPMEPPSSAPMTAGTKPPPPPLPGPIMPAAFADSKSQPADKKHADAPPAATGTDPFVKGTPVLDKTANKPSVPEVPAKSPPPSAKPKVAEKKNEAELPPRWNAPATVTPPATTQSLDHGDRDSVKTQPGEPPLAPAPGPVQMYRVHNQETLQDIARRTLGSGQRWGDLHKLNPTLQPGEMLTAGTIVRLPADACVQADDAEPVKPLPALRPKPTTPKAKVLPLTGTYQCSLDEKGQLTLPRSLRDQLNSSDTVLLSPGPDRCLWLTNQAHLERLAERLEQSQANEADVRVFKRLYFAQTEKLAVNGDGRVVVPERLKDFAGLHQEVVLVGIDDHFEVWDAARWRSYTQQKSATRYATTTEPE